MNIDLEGAIVVIDEAHNIEDTCRSAGSFEWSQEMVGGNYTVISMAYFVIFS